MVSELLDDSDEKLEGSPISCFVIGPIGDRDAARDSPDRQRYEEAIQVWEEVILPACEGFGIQPIRADHIAMMGEIPEQVFKRLRDDHLVIADLTGANPNVMYELGLRHTTGKLTIQIGENARLPFDVSAIRTIKFKRTEAGLIDARKRLAQAIGIGLQRGGDPVTATRVWFERPLLAESAMNEFVDSSADNQEESGFLEKLADMTEGLESSSKVAENVAATITEIGQLVRDATAQNERINKLGGTPGAKLEIANKLARSLEGHATRLEVLVGEYNQALERIHPGVVYVLKRVREDEQAREDAGTFTSQILSLILTVEGTGNQMVSFKMSLLEAGEATRELRRVNRRIAASIQSMLDANLRMQEWRALLTAEGPPNNGDSPDT